LKKTVDVIVPAYNAEKFIAKTLESVVSQTHLPEKIIIVDDGSTDGTISIINDFKNNSKVKIELYRQENRGPNAARNKGLRHSTADFIAFLDADDLWEPNKLEKQIKVFNNTGFSNLGLVYTAYDLIDRNGDKIKQKYLVFKLDPGLRGDVFNQMFEAMKITGSCSGVLIKKECFSRVGLFDESLRGAEDWDMWIRISREFQIDFADEILVHVRLHSTNAHNDQLMMTKNMIMLLKKWSSILDKDHPGRLQMAEKSLDYFFKAIFLFRLTEAFKILKLLQDMLLPEEKKVLFCEHRNSIKFFILLTTPKYIKKQIKRISEALL